jgi:hypothetical protein
MPAVTVDMVATAPTMNCCKKRGAATASDGRFERARKEVVAAYFKPRRYTGGTEESYGKFSDEVVGVPGAYKPRE